MNTCKRVLEVVRNRATSWYSTPWQRT